MQSFCYFRIHSVVIGLNCYCLCLALMIFNFFPSCCLITFVTAPQKRKEKKQNATFTTMNTVVFTSKDKYSLLSFFPLNTFNAIQIFFARVNLNNKAHKDRNSLLLKPHLDLVFQQLFPKAAVTGHKDNKDEHQLVL